ncbi:hypothetical protein [Microbacterium sp. GXF7504]
MTRHTARLGATAAVLVLAAALTACTGDGADPATPSASASASAAGDAFAGIGFEEGAALDPSWQAQWGDPFIGRTDFTEYIADDGNGTWAYREEATGCVLGYWQGPVEGFDPAAGDAAASDQLLALQFGAEAADLADYVGDDVLFASFDGPVAARSVAGADDTTATTYIVAARTFTALGAGLVATLDCPQEVDVYAQWVQLLSDPGAFTAVVGPLG